jgi:hypothetical protein
MDAQLIHLSTLCEGAAEERFQEKLQEVIENIHDPNTPWKANREITIRVIFTPDQERGVAAVGLSVEAKLAPMNPVPTTVFIGRRDGKLLALESNAKQQSLFNAEPARPVAVNKE